MTNEREEARRKAEVMLAFADGAEIQFCRYHWTNEDWDDVGHPSWNWDGNDYRVKPKPAEFWVVVANEINSAVGVFQNRENAQIDSKRWANGRIIHVREVTE